MFIDILLIVASILIIIYGARRGFISSLFGLVAWVAAVICVIKFSAPVSEWIYTDILRDSMVQRVSDTLQNEYAFGTAQSTYNTFAQSMADLMNATQGMLDIDNSQSVLSYNTQGLSANEVAITITDSYLSQIITKLCKWIVSIFGFFVLMAIFGAVGNLISKMIKATPFKKVDGLLGGVVGAVKAIIMLIVISILLRMSTGIIQSNNALKSIQNQDEAVKVSSFVNSIENSRIVSTASKNISL